MTTMDTDRTTETSRGITAAQRAEIEEARAAQSSTRRATVEALEEILYEPLPVLDHGFVRVIDYMGDDAAVVQAQAVAKIAGGLDERNVQARPSPPRGPQGAPTTRSAE